MQPKAQEHLEPPEAGNGRKDPPLVSPQECAPADTLISRFWYAEDGRECICLALSPQSMVKSMLGQPQNTSAGRAPITSQLCSPAS